MLVKCDERKLAKKIVMSMQQKLNQLLNHILSENCIGGTLHVTLCFSHIL